MSESIGHNSVSSNLTANWSRCRPRDGVCHRCWGSLWGGQEDGGQGGCVVGFVCHVSVVTVYTWCVPYWRGDVWFRFGVYLSDLGVEVSIYWRNLKIWSVSCSCSLTWRVAIVSSFWSDHGPLGFTTLQPQPIRIDLSVLVPVSPWGILCGSCAVVVGVAVIMLYQQIVYRLRSE